MGQINPINGNFHLKKSLKFFDKNSTAKFWYEKEIKISPSCLLGLIVKCGLGNLFFCISNAQPIQDCGEVCLFKINLNQSIWEAIQTYF